MMTAVMHSTPGAPIGAPDADPLMTVSEIMDYLKCSRSTVYTMIRGQKNPDGTYRITPKVPHLRVGSWGIRVRKSEIDKYVNRDDRGNGR